MGLQHDDYMHRRVKQRVYMAHNANVIFHFYVIIVLVFDKGGAAKS